ncbi:hypothetical protein CDAR_39641 [Caerostris darwini]|uniref:Uncharacterized protein n=1 Tax=Caerostris darwini TaxID=1538125 RepID=A0AAV4U6F1_9ARAC|nr:hypothetical protein CDAR_39641 [Caerostris darwini]
MYDCAFEKAKFQPGGKKRSSKNTLIYHISLSQSQLVDSDLPLHQRPMTRFRAIRLTRWTCWASLPAFHSRWLEEEEEWRMMARGDLLRHLMENSPPTDSNGRTMSSLLRIVEYLIFSSFQWACSPKDGFCRAAALLS